MKAIVQDRYGSPDVLELREIERPVNGDDQVLVRVHAAGVDQGVWHEVAGLPYLFRIAGIGVRVPKNPIPCRDVAGSILWVGGVRVGLMPSGPGCLLASRPVRRRVLVPLVRRPGRPLPLL